MFTLLDDLPVPDVSRLKTDVFREQVDLANEWHRRIARAWEAGPAAVRGVWTDLGDLRDVESGVLVDLLLSLRALEAYEDMVAFVEALPDVVAAATMVREQYAFALNRAGRSGRAEEVLVRLVQDRGPSSETYGLLGRVYKDRWERSLGEREGLLARGHLDQAIEAYLKGFETDWRDAYPGINAVQLMELREPPDPRAGDLLPVVRYSVERRLAGGRTDYWDYATLLELAVLAEDPHAATAPRRGALAAGPEPWAFTSTAASLRRLREARERRDHPTPWALQIEQALERAASKARRAVAVEDGTGA